MTALLGIVTVLLEYIDRLMPIMPALCSMLLVTYYAFNYAGIIGRGLLMEVGDGKVVQGPKGYAIACHRCSQYFFC